MYLVQPDSGAQIVPAFRVEYSVVMSAGLLSRGDSRKVKICFEWEKPLYSSAKLMLNAERDAKQLVVVLGLTPPILPHSATKPSTRSISAC